MIGKCNRSMVFSFLCFIDHVLLFCSNTSQQCFPLTPLQQQPLATSQPAVFFSHTTPAAASSTNTTNMAITNKVIR